MTCNHLQNNSKSLISCCGAARREGDPVSPSREEVDTHGNEKHGPRLGGKDCQGRNTVKKSETHTNKKNVCTAQDSQRY